MREYASIHKTLKELSEDRKVPGDMRCKLSGRTMQLTSYRLLFGVMLCEQLFAPCELLAKQLQNPAATIGDMVEGAQLLISQIRSMRSDTALAALFDRVDKFTDSVDVDIMKAPQHRTNKVPRRLEQQSVTALDATLDE